MKTISQRAAAAATGGTIGIAVTAKEKLLKEAPHWTEHDAEVALRAVEGEHADGAGPNVDEWGDLHAQTQALAEQASTRLSERERRAGKTWR